MQLKLIFYFGKHKLNTCFYFRKQSSQNCNFRYNLQLEFVITVHKKLKNEWLECEKLLSGTIFLNKC